MRGLISGEQLPAVRRGDELSGDLQCPGPSTCCLTPPRGGWASLRLSGAAGLSRIGNKVEGAHFWCVCVCFGKAAGGGKGC